MYIDDFGNHVSKKQFKELKKQGSIKIRLKNKTISHGIILKEYYGNISDTLKLKVMHFLEQHSTFKINPKENIIIQYAIDHRCNIVNNINLKKYISAINKRDNVVLFLMVDNYDEKIKSQIVDETDLIKNNFFNYINWPLSDVYKCGGALLLYPDNTFLRIYGEYDPMNILNRINKHDPILKN